MIMFMEDHGLEHGDYVCDYGVSQGYHSEYCTNIESEI